MNIRIYNFHTKNQSFEQHDFFAVPITCDPNHFQCKINEGTSCVNIAWVCDGEKECSDGSDEMDCPGCMEGEYQCKKKSLVKTDHCDGVLLCKCILYT